eukprot:scaffold10230_cov150-Amphora_coffeaeformis.AAC.2
MLLSIKLCRVVDVCCSTRKTKGGRRRVEKTVSFFFSRAPFAPTKLPQQLVSSPPPPPPEKKTIRLANPSREEKRRTGQDVRLLNASEVGDLSRPDAKTTILCWRKDSSCHRSRYCRCERCHRLFLLVLHLVIVAYE